MTVQKRLLVIGGGAAGFFCAVNAARLNPMLEVVILEKSSKLLSKVAISGGGRCNVTHACFEISEMIKKYPRGTNFVKKTFHRFFTIDTIKWFEERQVMLKTEADGRMFPVSNSSQTIIDCLMKEANKYKVKIMMNTEVKRLTRETSAGSDEHENQHPGAGKFVLQIASTANYVRPNVLSGQAASSAGQAGGATEMTADFVCIASGGYPKLSMFDWLKDTGHSIAAPVPSLFTFNMPGNAITQLMGISVENAKVKILGSRLETSGPLLITHWGLSGPAILKLSAWGARELAEGNYSFTAIVNWLPKYNEQTMREKFEQLRFDIAAQKLINKNPFALPARLWEYFLQQAGVKAESRWADLPAAAQNKLIKMLCAQECAVKGKTTFKEEFVTAGGVQLNEVDANTMMSKLVPGLFFAGEIVDVDGVTGGFNFQHAWTSGWIAARSISDAAGILHVSH
ncbi:MAG: NAD(P)/FAD-dependent oxidoreductase [Chitinophagaceae bacterium]